MHIYEYLICHQYIAHVAKQKLKNALEEKIKQNQKVCYPLKVLKTLETPPKW